MKLTTGSMAFRLLLPTTVIMMAIISMSHAKLMNVESNPEETVNIEVTQEELESATKVAMEIRDKEAMSISNGTSVRPGDTPASIVNDIRRIRNAAAALESKEAELGLLIAQQIAKTRLKSRYSTTYNSIKVIRDSSFAYCHDEPKCEAFEKYRTLNGSCNNLDHPLWGTSHTAFSRYLDPNYSDGIMNPRKAVSGKELPSARLVSTIATGNLDRPHRDNTAMVMQFAQFLDHDLSHTPIVESSGFTCCPANPISPCFPITIPANDTFFGPFKQNCMEFVRSAPVKGRDCALSPREQMNTLTSYIDGSNIYGSTESEAIRLRSRRGGQLSFRLYNGQQLLPSDYVEECKGQRLPCFLAGDSRVNEQPNLIVMHTIWMREHNRIVTRLAQMNPTWNDETLYQEGRRIVGAMLQHIVYSAYLPRVLGTYYMSRYRLNPTTHGYADVYDSKVDASITNEFATAAYRYGHTLIQGNLKGLSSNYQLVRNFSLSSVAFAPSFIYDETAIDDMLRGLFTQQCQSSDRNFVSEITNLLFARNASFGMDLVALNIQRGRDHGIPSYLELRKACGLRTVTSFSSLRSYQSSYYDYRLLESLYESVEDIDLFIGGTMERPYFGGLVGETFQCLIGEAFIRLKRGDRFYYENGDNPITRFTPRQLEEIKKTTLARVICDNSAVAEIPLDVFDVDGPRVPCLDIRKLPVVDLEQWRDSEHHY